MKITFPSKYLQAADLQDKPVTLVMSRVDQELVGINKDEKYILYFTKAKKGLVLNKTNYKTIVAAYGDESDDWEGKPVTLFPAMVDFAGDTVEAIRLRIPKAAQPPKPAPQSHDELNPPDGIDDEIQF